MGSKNLKVFLIVMFALVLSFSGCGKSDPAVKTPGTGKPAGQAEVKSAESTPSKKQFSWQQDQAKVLPNGDLEWDPKPFVFEKGDSVRYVDFESGKDSNDGLSKETAWKHHPWDVKAGGKAKACTGIHTYVFKRGVIYRGRLVARDSGTKDNPVRLTSDPSWGEGEAVLTGAENVTGWKKGADHKDIPEKEKVWYKDLDWPVRMVWMTEGDTVTRIPLARTPNWKVSNPEDVLSEWWVWENPQWWIEKNRTATVGKRKMCMGVDTKHLTESPEYYKGATVWSEWAIVMGTPFPAPIEAFYPEKKAIAFQGRWFGTSVQIHTGNRYCLEDKPHYLDDPDGEFWFEKKGKGGRLYLRLPEGKDPNVVNVEVGKRYNIIEDVCSDKSPLRMDIYRGDKNKLDNGGLKNAVISGLTFRFLNTWWDIVYPPWMHKEVNNAGIRLLGSVKNLTIKNCKFKYINKAIRIEPLTGECKKGLIVISDNDIQYTDHTAVLMLDDSIWTSEKGKSESVSDFRFLRNNLFMIGLRPYRQSDGHAVYLTKPELMEVAGNVLYRCYGAGLFLSRGKDMGGRPGQTDVPFNRMLVYQNKVTDSLLTANDWGGIETNCAGPAYVFDNISGNPGGFWNWAWQNGHKPNNARLGMAYYFDGGGSKTYFFNNIAWGKNNDLKSPECNHCGLYNAGPNVFNSIFNNTFYKFGTGCEWSPGGGNNRYLGNIWDDISQMVFKHSKVKEDKNKEVKDEYPHYTNAYGSNVFSRVAESLAKFDKSGKVYSTIEAFNEALVKYRGQSTDVGVMADSDPLPNASEHDFRPGDGTAAGGKGVGHFTPWPLYKMVAEWNFCRNNADPTVMLDEHFYMAPYAVDRVTYALERTFPLKGVNVTAGSFVDGALENWTQGALEFNGTDTFAVLKDSDMKKEFSYTLNTRKGKKTHNVTSDQIACADAKESSLIVEIYFKTSPGITEGILVEKMAMGSAGYRLEIGGKGTPVMTVAAGGKESMLAGTTPVNDGTWHHVLAELDRNAGKLNLYVDGKNSGSAPISIGLASLSNTSDFLVGKGTDGLYFKGAVDFLRISLGSLADAQTTIEELYAWQFEGPQYRDFAGNKRADKPTAGALEAVR